MAAAALSVSLEAFDKESWPAALQQFGSYLPSDLAAAKARLVELQAGQVRAGAAGRGALSEGAVGGWYGGTWYPGTCAAQPHVACRWRARLWPATLLVAGAALLLHWCEWPSDLHVAPPLLHHAARGAAAAHLARHARAALVP